MNIKEYQEKAHGTSMNTNIFGSKLLYPLLGMIDETGEISEKIATWGFKAMPTYLSHNDMFPDNKKIEELKKEIGDVLWYFAETCTHWGIDMNELGSLQDVPPYDPLKDFPFVLLEFNGEISKIYGKVKKKFRDDKERASSDSDILKDEEFKSVMKKHLQASFLKLQLVCSQLNIALQEVAEMNIEKLYSRLDRNKITGSGDNR